MLDVARLRRETRGADAVAHLNNAGASLPPAPVADLVVDWLRDEETTGGYETADRRRDELEAFYDAAASLLGCVRDEVAFLDNATRAWDMAFYGLELGHGDRVLTTASEYGSNVIAYLHRARRTGCEIVVVPDDEHGQIDLGLLEAAIDERTRLIAINHVPTGGGLVQPAAEVGALARAAGVPFLLDACQSAGQLPLDVGALGCDFLSATGRKWLRGPRGTGLLYVREEWIDRLDPPLLDIRAAELVGEDAYVVRSDARRFETWERFMAGQAGLGRAISYALDVGVEAIAERVRALAERLRAALADLPEVTVTDVGERRCGIVTFRHARVAAAAVQAALSAARCNVSVADGSPSRVWFDRRGLDAVVRASPHYFNTEAELDRLVDVVAAL